MYFLTDGEPVEFRRFITALLRSQGVEPGTRELPGWVDFRKQRPAATSS